MFTRIFYLFLLILSNISSFAEIQKNRQHVEKIVRHMAQFVGEEEFALKVGQALIKRSADVGLRVDGVVTNSGLEAQKVINQPLQDVHIDQHNAFAVPLADAIALFGAIDELTLLRRQTFEAMKSQGISDREAVEVLNLPEVKSSLIHLSQKTEALHECEQKIQEKAEKLALESITPHDGSQNSPPSDLSATPDQPSLTAEIQIHIQQQELQGLLKERQTLAREVTQEADKLKLSNREFAPWIDRFKEGIDWVSHQYEQFLEHCRGAGNWALDHKCTMAGSGLIATGLFVATLPLSGPAFAVSGGAVALTAGVETVGVLAAGAGLTGAGTTILMNAQHEGSGGKSKADTPSQANPQPQTKPGQVGEYGKLKKASVGDSLDAHHVPHDQYMKVQGIKKDEGISMLLDRPTHRAIHFGPKGLKSINPQTPARTALYKSLQRTKNILQEKGIYSGEWRNALKKIIQENIDKFPHLFGK